MMRPKHKNDNKKPVYKSTSLSIYCKRTSAHWISRNDKNWMDDEYLHPIKTWRNMGKWMYWIVIFGCLICTGCIVVKPCGCDEKNQANVLHNGSFGLTFKLDDFTKYITQYDDLSTYEPVILGGNLRVDTKIDTTILTLKTKLVDTLTLDGNNFSWTSSGTLTDSMLKLDSSLRRIIETSGTPYWTGYISPGFKFVDTLKISPFNNLMPLIQRDTLK